MKETELNRLLLEVFPELSEEFEEYTSWQDGMDTGCFLTYEDLLLPKLVEAVGIRDTRFVERGCKLIEKLVTSDDDYARNLACVGLLEGLKAFADNETVRQHLGPRSLAEFDAMVY